VLTTDQKGSLAEAKIICAAIELGIDVLRPLNDGTRYDLVFDLHPNLVRIQCKTGVRCDEIIRIGCYSTRRTATGLRKRCYSAAEIDAFAVYCPDIDRCYFLPLEAFGARSHSAAVGTDQEQPAASDQLGQGLRIRGYTGATWGRSSAGRAPARHAGGHGFESRRLHSICSDGPCRSAAPRLTRSRSQRSSPSTPGAGRPSIAFSFGE
jgi:PD-(D/E)XK endonuclease